MCESNESRLGCQHLRCGCNFRDSSYLQENENYAGCIKTEELKHSEMNNQTPEFSRFSFQFTL